MDLHAVFKHGCISPSLIKVGSNRVRSVSTENHTPHTALLESFSHLPKEILRVFRVRVNDHDFANVLLPQFIDRVQYNQVLFTTGSGRVDAVHVHHRRRTAGDHRNGS